MKQQETHLKQQVSYPVCVLSLVILVWFSSLPPSAGNNPEFLNLENAGAGLLLGLVLVSACQHSVS